MGENKEAAVQEAYGQLAKSELSGDAESIKAIAEAFGYSAEELGSIPAEANMGVSCGNPVAMASLRPGETVVDLGSGGGLDVFLASKSVGPEGKAIGIDMTPEMIARAQKNAQENNYTNVEFYESRMDDLPLEDQSVDCVISNCAINLASNKEKVFSEIFRILKTQGRLAVSDIALKRELPDELRGEAAAYVGCIAGAVHVNTYRETLESVGFQSIEVIDSGANLNMYGEAEVSAKGSSSEQKSTLQSRACCSSSKAKPQKGTAQIHEGMESLLSQYDLNEYAASVKVFALKP